MTIHSFAVTGTPKEESPLSQPSAEQKYTLSNYLTGQIPAIELPLNNGPRLFTLVSKSTSDILKEYSGGERSSTPPKDTSDPRVFSRTHSSAVLSTHSLHPSSSGDVSTSQSQSVMSSVIYCQSRDQIRKELNQNYDFLITLRAAQKGSSEAQRNLGSKYQRGQGVKQDEAQAVYWYRKAAEQGDADAQCNLGLMYEQGQGVKRSKSQAVFWFSEAAKQGHAAAQCNLGNKYLHGEGVRKDESQAVCWYRKAAEQGHAQAQVNMGWMYSFAKRVKKDKVEAFFWYRKAADQGHAQAQKILGWMYDVGTGVKQDAVESFNWYLKAAENGLQDAYAGLATHYQEGRGVEKDVLQATYCLLKSRIPDEKREIILGTEENEVAKDFYSDVIPCIPAVLAKFPEFKFINTINFWGCKSSDQDFFSIGEMIRANPNLEGLDFKYSKIDNARALILSQSLAFNTTLTKLTFGDRYSFDINIFNEIKASLAQNVVIVALREHMKHNIITRSDDLPIEVLNIIVDDMIVKASRAGKSKEATIAAIDEFLLIASRQTLENTQKKSS